MNGFTRSTHEYLMGAIESFKSVEDGRTLYGVFVPHAPESFTELQEMYRANCAPNTEGNPGVNNFMELIASFPDPDEIVRELPYSPVDGAVFFMLPDLDRVQKPIY